MEYFALRLYGRHTMPIKTIAVRSFSSRHGCPQFCAPPIETVLTHLAEIPANRSLIDDMGGIEIASQTLTSQISNALYTSTFQTTKYGQPFAEPYIISFCTTHNQEIATHGLLSQWRGYGMDGGYAIVFDTKRLATLLEEDHKHWRDFILQADAIYSSDSDDKIRGELGDDFDAIANSISRFLLSDGSADALEPIYYALVKCASRYKHWGFHEEKEVRIVVIPHSKQVLQFTKPEWRATHERPLGYFPRAGTPVPFINLFEGITHLPDKPLPITRIIVGPHPEKDKRKHAVERLLSRYGLPIPVSASQIPFLGRS